MSLKDFSCKELQEEVRARRRIAEQKLRDKRDEDCKAIRVRFDKMRSDLGIVKTPINDITFPKYHIYNMFDIGASIDLSMFLTLREEFELRQEHTKMLEEMSKLY